MKDVESIMTLAPVIPVLIIDDIAHARPIAEALVAGGLCALEVTLRTPAALDVIREMAKVEGAVVGAGTVLNEYDLHATVQAGARFIVSPGLTEPLSKKALGSGIPFLPGIATAGDIMRGLDMGLSRFKFFPAVAAGGIPTLKALSSAFPRCRFCPTGGITQENAAEWLALDAVSCVAGTWLVPRGSPEPMTLTAAAKKAAQLR